jgi:hypothetical protein
VLVFELEVFDADEVVAVGVLDVLTTWVVAVCVSCDRLVVAPPPRGTALPDPAITADSIPLASNCGYARLPLALRDDVPACVAPPIVGSDCDTVGAVRRANPAVGSGMAAALSASSVMAASSAGERTADPCDREAPGGSMNFPRGTDGPPAEIVMSCVRARTFSAGNRTSPRGIVM